jgi:hypothetical protein
VRLDSFLLAEYASVENDKLYVIGGGITRIEAPQLPWTQALALIARFALSADERRHPHLLSMSMTRPDGELLFDARDIGLPVTEEKRRAEGEERYGQLVLVFQQIPFPETGIYRLNLAMDGEHFRSVSLPVVHAAKPG